MSAIVAGLEQRGRDPRSTGIRQLAWMLTKHCRRCGALKWETTPAAYVSSAAPNWT